MGAVVHTHPILSSALATVAISLDRASKRLRKKIGSKTKILKYYTPGSRRLAAEVKRAIKKVNAVVLAHHGLVTVGKDIAQAYQRTLACEEEAKIILASLRKK